MHRRLADVDTPNEHEEPGLSARQLEAWISVIALMETLPGAIDQQLKRDAGVNLFEYTVLAMLSEEPGRTLPMSVLAEACFGSLSRLSHAVGRLEKRGWVRKQSGSGREPNTVSLTDDGLGAVRTVAGPHRAHVKELVLDPITDNELATLVSICRKVLAVADPDVAQFIEERVPEVIDRNSG